MDGKFKEDVIVIRVYGQKTDLIIDRDAEKNNMQLLHKYNLCPPLYAVLPNGIAYGFAQGETLDMETVRDDTISELIAKELVKLQSVKLSDSTNPKSALFTKIDCFFKALPEKFEDADGQKRFVETIKPKEVLLQERDRLQTVLESMDCPIVLAHNDLLLKNIIYNKDEGRVTFIDHEYGMYNYQPYDIGNHFAEYAGIDEVDYSRYPDKAYQLKWLRRYLLYWNKEHGKGEVTDEDVEKLYVQVNKCTLAAHFFWGIWGLIQAKHSLIDFDYLDYARIRLDEYFNKRDEFLALTFP